MIFLIGLVGQHDALDDPLLLHFLGPGFDHDDAVLRADDGHPQGALPELLGGRIDDEFVVDKGDLDCAKGGCERDIREIEGGRGADDAQHVGLVLQVGRKEEADDLGVEEIAVGKQGPDRPVDHPGGQDLALGRSSFAFEEAAGDLARGICVLPVVDDQGEEGFRFLHFLFGRGRDQHDGFAVAHQGGAVGLFRDLADLYGQGPFVDFKTYGVRHFDSLCGRKPTS